MHESANYVSEVTNKMKMDLERSRDRFLHIFSFVPVDKINWSPTATSRSSARIVAHCAVVCEFVIDGVTGKLPENPPSVEEFFKIQGEKEIEIATHQDVVVVLKESLARLSKIIDTVTSENINEIVHTSFGPMPIQVLISIPQEQLAGHTAQLEYLQTIWGDVDNHLN